VHRQPRAKIPFSCASSGGSPDSYCALSGVHRTGTVDCPVCPYSVFKKPSSARARGQAHFLPPASALCLRQSPPLAGDLPSPASSVLRRPRPSASLLPSLGEQLLLPLSSLSLYFSSSEAPSSTPLCSFKIPVNSSETKWSYVFLCVP
jgi:hypothetical protein